MDSIGAEVGQKMRSAIKAKLLELSCYVDDELPDYIMVMVANKRTKSQMNEDLNLFLSTKTSTFVDWLHIVLKKLKEVTVTNPEVYKKVSKRKSSETSDLNVKKEKYILLSHKEKQEPVSSANLEQNDSLTDGLPVSASCLSEKRKITVVSENGTNNNDIFDIPLLSQVNSSSNEQDLQEVEKKIKSVKSRLGLLVDSDIEEELPEYKLETDIQKGKLKISNIKKEHEYNELDNENDKNKVRNTSESEKPSQLERFGNTKVEGRTEHKRIFFDEGSPPKRVSVLDRLGSRLSSTPAVNPLKPRTSSELQKEEEAYRKYSKNEREEKERDWRKRKEHRIDRSRHDTDSKRCSPERRRDRSRDRKKERSSDRSRSNSKMEGIMCRVGVMSKVSVPYKEPEPEDELKTREVRSMVQVKPRTIPAGAPQPNKTLLLKAMAEAQRSVAQTPQTRFHAKSNPLKVEIARDETKRTEGISHTRKFSLKEKNKLKNLILSYATHDKTNNDGKYEEEYIPKPIAENIRETPKYVPSSRLPEDSDGNVETPHQFIVTLDGIERKLPNTDLRIAIKDKIDSKVQEALSKLSVKSRLDRKKSPSPIIFDKVSTGVNSRANIPDKLSLVHPPLAIKHKERCKYWPNCKQGDKCEFIHPNNPCEMFPHCKFGEKCLFLHPTCKFGSSCTKRECPYSHSIATKIVPRTSSIGVGAKLITSGLQTCKFFPNCTNSNCQFYHPKPCKFGKYCKNQSECSFSHFNSNKSNLTWHSK